MPFDGDGTGFTSWFPKGIRQGAKAPRQLARLTPQTTRPHGRLVRSLTPVQRKFQVGTISGGSWTFKSVGSNKSTQWKTITDYHSPFLSQFKSCQLSVGLLQLYILVGGWPTPLEKYEFVSWDDDIPNLWKVIKFLFQTTSDYKQSLTIINHQYFPKYALNMSTSIYISLAGFGDPPGWSSIATRLTRLAPSHSSSRRNHGEIMAKSVFECGNTMKIRHFWVDMGWLMPSFPGLILN